MIWTYRTLTNSDLPASESSDDFVHEKGLQYGHLQGLRYHDSPLRLTSLIVLCCSIALNVYLILFGRGTGNTNITPLDRYDPMWDTPDLVYSPAQSAVKYETRVFTALGVQTKYHGPPTDETDEAWDALYPIGVARITAEEASQLSNWTSPIPGDEGHYVVGLDVFHQLHCLNTVRKALWPQRYSRHDTLSAPGAHTHVDHVDHCLNILREHIVCTANTTPNVFQWSEDKKMIFPHFDSVHVCRNWESITEWAANHKFTKPHRDISKLPGHHVE
ncbi:hypothetical protein SISNIDRAFT_497640 [Sistotremastrum niveocremeum HHB9708]|uniref:Tat pathway signal sequence n=2 Tax=Sistotremastraceae TaxID=3402574 RepID=A0A164PVH1_9AGAM|nr:hypothetical protein SISNIDRAFT_497640 [Sistotremastrum niveocremeum HHB9708]KZT34415.1 hypothetical protein SISSUDRAFT_1009934 [Sistotremastrum suecicum HHB10207 ss-3]